MSSTTQHQPWLLYSYPWMPYPRRIQLYLREKQIPTTAVTIVHVTDPQKGNCVVQSQANVYPPRPEGSLPVLAIPTGKEDDPWIYIRQSMAIIDFLEAATAPGGELTHLQTRELHTANDALKRARLIELTTLAEELTVIWNPIRTFGSGAGTMKYPDCAKEMFRWVSRVLAAVDKYLDGRDFVALKDEETRVSVADIVLYQFFEFIDYCYGINLTVGTGEKKVDVYGRDVKETYPNLKAFYEGFQGRKSARREEELGELASEDVLEKMRFWHAGVW